MQDRFFLSHNPVFFFTAFIPIPDYLVLHICYCLLNIHPLHSLIHTQKSALGEQVLYLFCSSEHLTVRSSTINSGWMNGWMNGAFELWCWRRLLRVLWAAGRSNQSILKEISPGCSLEGLMLKLKLQYFGHLMRRVDTLEKTLMLGGIGGRRRRGRQRMDEMAGWHHWLDGRESEGTRGVGDGQGGLACWDSWGRKESDTTEWLNWTGTGPFHHC